MKKVILVIGLMLATTAIFAQTKPKSTKQLRDSVFTEMKLSDENRAKMHQLISDSGTGSKAIKDDTSLTDEQKAEKLKEHGKAMRDRLTAILTPEQAKMWSEFGVALKKKNATAKQ